MNPYEKSLTISKGVGAASVKELKIRQLQSDYKKSFFSSIECIPTARRNGVVQPVIAHRSHLSDSYTLSAQVDDTIFAGDIFEFFGLNWIVSSINANREIYTSGAAIRCNHFFEFQNHGNSRVIQRWGAIVSRIHSDQVGTEALTYLAQTCQIILPYDNDTALIHVDKRLPGGIMYDAHGNKVLIVYRVTSIDGSSLYDNGDHLLVLNVRSDVFNPTTDNIDLQLCDYVSGHTEDIVSNCNILHNDGSFIRAGGMPKTFGSQFLDPFGNIEIVPNVRWDIAGGSLDGITLSDSNSPSCKLTASQEVAVGTLFTLKLMDIDDNRTATIIVEVVGLY